MADLPLGSAVVEVKANLAPLGKGLKDARGETDKAVTGMRGAFDRLRGSVTGLGAALGGLGIAAAATGFGVLVTRALNAVEAIADVAARASVSAERLQELRFAFSQNGVEVGRVDQALVKFNAVLGEFIATGAGAAQQGFRLIGIESAAAAQALGTTEQAFDDVVDRLSRIADPAQRAGAAARIFGEEAGPALAVLIGQGSAKIDELRQKARDLGVVLRNDAVASAADASAQLRALGETVKAQVTGALIEAAPYVVVLAQALADSIPVILQWGAAVARVFGADVERNIATRVQELAAVQEDIRRVVTQGAADLGPEFGGSSTMPDLAALESRQEVLLAELRDLEDRRAARTPAAPNVTRLTLPGVPAAAGAGGAAAREADAYERLIEAVHDRQRAGLDELRVASAEEEQRGRLRAAIDAARIARDLEAAAIRDGLAITPALRAEIDAATGAYAAMRNAVDAANEAQRDQARAAEESKRAVEAVGDAITGGIQQADSFADALKNVALALANIAIQGVFGAGPLGGALGGLLANAKGAAFVGGAVTAFARGGVVSAPTMFPMAGGDVGLMGEAGPEAILPLRRGPGGRLGVETSGGGGRVEIVLSPGLEARILDAAAAQSVRISQQSLAQVPALNRDQQRRGAL